MVERHEEIVEDILKHVRPLAYFNNYLEYGYYPIYLEEKSHIDYLLIFTLQVLSLAAIYSNCFNFTKYFNSIWLA